jgi:hypothetical protein
MICPCVEGQVFLAGVGATYLGSNRSLVTINVWVSFSWMENPSAEMAVLGIVSLFIGSGKASC